MILKVFQLLILIRNTILFFLSNSKNYLQSFNPYIHWLVNQIILMEKLKIEDKNINLFNFTK